MTEPHENYIRSLLAIRDSLPKLAGPPPEMWTPEDCKLLKDMGVASEDEE